MNSPLPMHLSPRCPCAVQADEGAVSSPCREGMECLPVSWSRWGRSERQANGNYRHGRFTCEAIAQKQEISALIKMMAQFAQKIE